MRPLLMLLICISSFSSIAQSKDEQSILSSISYQQKAWNNGDLVSFMDTYWKSDSLMFIGKSGVTYGWQNTL
ncbi:MAG: DUF4440 domain-containing protein, partial [Chitinophagaceae bacterium]